MSSSVGKIKDEVQNWELVSAGKGLCDICMPIWHLLRLGGVLEQMPLIFKHCMFAFFLINITCLLLNKYNMPSSYLI